MTEAAIPPTEKVLVEHATFVREFCRGMIRDEHLAEDVAQETLAAGLSRSAGQLRNPRGWLTTVARNLTRRAHRTAARRAAAHGWDAIPGGLLIMTLTKKLVLVAAALLLLLGVWLTLPSGGESPGPVPGPRLVADPGAPAVPPDSEVAALEPKAAPDPAPDARPTVIRGRLLGPDARARTGVEVRFGRRPPYRVEEQGAERAAVFEGDRILSVLLGTFAVELSAESVQLHGEKLKPDVDASVRPRRRGCEEFPLPYDPRRLWPDAPHHGTPGVVECVAELPGAGGARARGATPRSTASPASSRGSAPRSVPRHTSVPRNVTAGATRIPPGAR